MFKKKKTYFGSIREGIFSLLEGIRLTFKHFRAATKKRSTIGVEDKDYFNQSTGIVTTEYPYEAIPVPDNGRYRLHNEIDDCIVCDLCAKICPVNCIDIVPIKSPEEIGKTSDGTTKRIFAATFDIDMAKCCYCGLCTTVCPTESLTMTKAYDFSEFDVRNMNYHFTDLSPKEAEDKKEIYEAFEKEKLRLKEEKAKEKVIETEKSETTEKKPAFKPVFKPKVENKEEGATESIEPLSKPKPVFKPVIKAPTPPADTTNKEASDDVPAKPKPVFKPIIKPKAKTEEEGDKKEEPLVSKPKPVFKPGIKAPSPSTDSKSTETSEENIPKPKPVFKPIIKPPKKDNLDS